MPPPPRRTINPVIEKLRKERHAKRPGSSKPENCRVHNMDVSNPYRLQQSVNDRFISQTTDKEALLKSETVGLVDLAEFQKIKDEVDSGLKREKKAGGSNKSISSKSNKKGEARLNTSVLSFAEDEQDDGEQGEAIKSVVT